MRGENPPSLPSILGVKVRGAAALFPGNPKCKAIPVRRSELWFPMQSPGFLPWHYWHTNTCVWPSAIQELSTGSSSTPQFTGAFFLDFFKFKKEKNAGR